MQKLNLGTRVEMFAICASLEYDLKFFMLQVCEKIEFTEDMIKKAKDRKKDIVSEEEILNQLDLGDFVTLICTSPFSYKINNEKSRELMKYFNHIIPVRNRVMHTKPLELGDRATLIEVMQYIAQKLPWIDWTELKNTKKIIEEDSSKLFSKKYIGIKEYNPKVYHNLPLPEFDDTGFIGRKKDIKEIKELLCNNKNQIISVVGNGGMGKTSTVLKILYDMIEQSDNPFEAIIWITLKTRTLSKGEFVEISESIKEIPQIFVAGKEAMELNEYNDSMEAVLEFMSVFDTLLVLDNLETINAGELNEFLRRIPDNSKLLITSRLGIGEFEVRQKIEGLSKADAVLYFRELSKYYGLSLHKNDDQSIYKLISEDLYNNPLSIKWFISGVFSGTSEKQMLAHKNELIEFCISNIFDKLSDVSKRILQLFLLENSKLTYGLIDYYIDEHELVIKNSLNELLSTYMIQASAGEYVMNEMSREYISLQFPPSNEFVKLIMQKRSQLKKMLQQVRVYVEQAPYNPNTICFKMNDIDQQLATFHLRNALKYGKDKQWIDSAKSIEKAMSIEPDFYEVYKVKAFLEAEKGELYSAMNNYQIALSKCTSDKEKSVVYYLFSVFYTVKMQDVDSALEYINQAELLAPESYEIKLEKVRVYTFTGKYDEAEKLWNTAKEFDKHPNLRTKNIMANRFMDLKNRQASVLQLRDYEEKYRIIKEGIDVLDSVPSIDDKTTVTLMKLLTVLSYNYFHKESIELICKIVEKYEGAISKLDKKSKERIITNLDIHREEIEKEKFERIYLRLSSFKTEAQDILVENEGVVVKLKDTYGFISNATYSYKKGLFFVKVNAYEDIKVGDKVRFDLYENIKGKAARNIQKI